MNNYDDIINFPHHVSTRHKPMSIYNRSAQFAPFSALTGYGEEIIETARLTDQKIDIDDGLKSILSDKLNKLNENINKKWTVQITHFVPDKKKNGGEYINTSGIIKKIDLFNDVIILFDKTKIAISDIIGISCEELNGDEFL